MGTSNSTRRSSGKQPAAFSTSRQRKLTPQKEEEVVPAYRKPELQDFECVICKDLVFKPVVNACGHAFFCFWCAHESMGAGFQNSSCPICRSTFSHMPRVCELAHSYLSKVWPQEYNARAIEVGEEERQRNMFSPEPIGIPRLAARKLQAQAGKSGGQVEPQETSRPGEGQQAVQPASEIVVAGGGVLADSDQEELGSSSACPHTMDMAERKHFVAEDCECLLCNQLLYQPVVLSCGHAYCFLCLEERFPSGQVVCAYCCKAHLEDEITACGQLQELIQGAFPQETFQRSKQERARMGTRTGLLKRVSAPQEDTQGPKGFVHFGIECDACGVYPIVGERFQCQDCEEEIGFDLCGRCHAAREQPMLGSYLFKQKHLPTHRMHCVEPVPTFLHQVMDTHPELSLTTVINMVMSMAEDAAEDGPEQSRSVAEDPGVDLGESNLFEEAPATAAQGSRAATAGAEGRPEEAAHAGEVADEGGHDEEETPVRDAAVGVDIEQGGRSADAVEDGLPEVGASEALADQAQTQGPVLAAEINQGQGVSEGRVAAASDAPSSEWVWVDGASQQAAGSTEGQASASTVGQQDAFLGDTVPGLLQRDCAGDNTLPADHSGSGQSSEAESAQNCLQSDGTANGGEHGVSNPTETFAEARSRAIVSEGQETVARSQGGQEVGEGTCVQASNGILSEGGGRAVGDERRGAAERPHRTSCEPVLQRSDSYHRLMVATA